MKKFIAIVCSVLAVTAVLGLNARLDYDDWKVAVESVGSSADVIIDDITVIDCMAYVFSDFQLGQDTDLDYLGYSEGGFYGTGYVLLVKLSVPDHESSAGVIHGGGGTRGFVFTSESAAVHVMNVLKPLTWNVDYNSSDGFWQSVISKAVDVLNVIALILGFIFTVVLFVVQIFLDTLSTAWSVVNAAFYILGFNVLIV